MTTAPSPSLARLYRLVPAIDSLRTYRLATCRADLIAGLTVATVAVPQAMAYALVAGRAARVRPLHGHRHDRRRRAVRLVAAAHQRPHQRHLDRRAQRGGRRSARAAAAGRHPAGVPGRAAPDGHHAAAGSAT